MGGGEDVRAGHQSVRKVLVPGGTLVFDEGLYDLPACHVGPLTKKIEV